MQSAECRPRPLLNGVSLSASFLLTISFILVREDGLAQESRQSDENIPSRYTVGAMWIVRGNPITIVGRDNVLELHSGTEDPPSRILAKLPDEDAIATELRVCGLFREHLHETTHFVFVVEAYKPSTKDRQYYLAWCRMDEKTGRLHRAPLFGRFFASPVDYDLVGIANPSSDTVYVMLAKHERLEERDRVTGWIYVNRCPLVGVSGESIGGTIYPLLQGPAEESE